MKELKHTPGPWTVDPMKTGFLGIVGTQDGRHYVANSLKIKPLRDDFHQLERQANARLIAAAPDLLQALQAFVENSSVQVNAPNECETAGIAIAKATGEAE